MKMDDSWYMDWILNDATEEEKYLVNRVNDFGELFEDMLFQEGTSSYELIQCESRLKDSGEWVSDESLIPEIFTCFSYNYFHFKVESLGESNGCYNHSRQTLFVSPGSLKDDKTILHELIHLHEHIINEMPLFYHDMMYWALYKDLKPRIPQLDELITGHAHVFNGSTIFFSGGLHDILFLLKSFDLDIRMGYSLGTVFAYGRKDMFKDYTYIKDSK